jgi:lipopolysaccharide/colanic/teichoic acid biosynthesis glycosyltransferase
MAPISYKHLTNDKAARMLEIYAQQQFRSTVELRRLRMALILWVIRAKVHRHLKRALDISVASLLFILTLPIMLVTALAIRLESRGPIFFRQTRTGKWGKPFTCYKFRSMYADAEQRMEELRALNEVDGPIFKMKLDPRTTQVGRIIRKLSIDELPQLLNVFRGEMSLVGPRPALPQEVAQYSYDQIGRLDAVPGLTGLQQVTGRSDLDFERWIELDLQYIAQQSLLMDVAILLRTIPTVILGKGAY